MFPAWLDFNRAVALAAGTVVAGGVFGAGVEVSSALSGTDSAEPAAQVATALPTSTAPAGTQLPAWATMGDGAAPSPRPWATGLPHAAAAATEAPVPAPTATATATATSQPSPAASPTVTSQVTTEPSPTASKKAAASPAPSRPAGSASPRPTKVKTPAPSPSAHKPAGTATTVVADGWSVPAVVPPGRWQLTVPDLSSGAPVTVSVAGCGDGCAFAANELFIKAPAGRVSITWTAPAVTGFSSWSTSITTSWG